VPELFEVVLGQRACRSFRDEDVPDELVLRCIEAATHAPSAENTQPWEFVVVRSAERRAAIGALMATTWDGGARAISVDRLPPELLADVERGAQGGIAAAPVLVVVCGSTARAFAATLPSSVYPATQNLLLAAAALGLGSAMTTLAVQRRDELRELLALPEHVAPMAVVPLGWPVRPLGPPRREPAASKAHREVFGTAW
jgi:nitroreductase